MFDCRELFEVNRATLQDYQEEAISRAPKGGVFLLMATWGKGCDPELLKSLEPYRLAEGFNGTLIALLSPDQAVELLEISEKPPEGNFSLISSVYKDSYMWDYDIENSQLSMSHLVL